MNPNRLAFVEQPLGERMADPISVRVLNISSHPVWSGMDSLAGEGVAFKHKTVISSIKPRVWRQHVSCEEPESFVEPIKKVTALNADLLDDLLVEIVQKFLASVTLTLGYLGFKLTLKWSNSNWICSGVRHF